jgi:hypothetical protein
MSIINKESKKYVENLFSKISIDKLIPNSGTEVGNYKSALLKKNGIDFIEKYDLLIDNLVHQKIYG